MKVKPFSRLVDLVRSELQFQVGVPPLMPEEREVWSLAKKHKVATILAPRILQESASEKFIDEARYYWQLASLREEYYRREIGKLRDQLSAKGIRVTYLKGLLLVSRVYPKMGFRAFRDADLFLPKHQIVAATELFLDWGFNITKTTGPLRGALPPRGDLLKGAEEGWTEIPLERDDLYIELHSVLLPRSLANYKPMGGDELSSEDHFAHLAFHATRHHFNYALRQILDLALWARANTLQFQIMEEYLLEQNVWQLAYPAWNLAHRYFPESVASPSTKSGRVASFYTKKISKNLAHMPERSILLAGSPLPFLFMQTSIYKSIREIVFPSCERSAFLFGEESGKSEFSKWKRIAGLIHRHTKIILRWIKFAFS